MTNGGSSKKPDIDLTAEEKMRVVLRVPAIIQLADGRIIKMRKLKIGELLEFSEELILAFRTMIKTPKPAGATAKQRTGFFMARMVRALWPELAKVMQRVISAEFEYDVNEADADDGLLILAKFIKLHKGVREAFFELMETFVPEVAGKIKKAFQDLSTSLSEQATSGAT